MSETYHTVSKASFLIDRLEALRELVDDLKFSSEEIQEDIENKLDELEDYFMDEIDSRQQALIKAHHPELS